MQCMISESNVKSVLYNNDFVFVVIHFKTMYNITIIRFSFCDIWNNRGRGKCYQPSQKVEANDTCLDLDYSGYHKNLIQ